MTEVICPKCGRDGQLFEFAGILPDKRSAGYVLHVRLMDQTYFTCQLRRVEIEQTKKGTNDK